MKTNNNSRFILNLLGIGTAISLLGDATLYTVLPHPKTAAQLGITLSMVGLLLGANRAIRLVLNGPVGHLYDRMPRRGLLVGAMFIGACSSIFYAIGHGFWPLLIGRILWGLAWSLLWVGGNSVVLDISAENNRGKNSGIYQMWFFIGVATASLFGAMLTDTYGFRKGQWISVVVLALTALTWLLLLPETRKNETPSKAPVNKNEKINFPWPVIISASFTVFITRFISWGVFAATSILWLSDLFGEGAQIARVFIPIATLAGLFTALSNITSIAGTRLIGSISDKIGKRWPIIGISMIIGGLGLWFMGSKIRGLALMSAFLVPMAGSSTETLIPAIAGDSVSVNIRSRVLGLINTAGDLGATLGPFTALGILNLELILLNGIYKIAAVLFGMLAIFAFSPFVLRLSKDKTNK